MWIKKNNPDSHYYFKNIELFDKNKILGSIDRIDKEFR